MNPSNRGIWIPFLVSVIVLFGGATASGAPYACEENLIEVMFEWDSKVRMRDGVPTDLRTNALAGVAETLERVGPVQWRRICDVPEETLDRFQANGEENTRERVYNLNNIYRLRIPTGLDVWDFAEELEALPGVLRAVPVPKPTPLPSPPNYQPIQNYLDPASSTPTGIDAYYAWTQPCGGRRVVDLEYGWNRTHNDIMQLGYSFTELNPNPLSLPLGETDDHGTAVAGVLMSDHNLEGTSGIDPHGGLRTCGTYYGSPASWNVAGAIMYAMANIQPGDVLLLEQQWDYYGVGDHVPIEWWGDYSPNPQSYNAVYAAIVNAVANNIHVVEAGGNSRLTSVGVDTDLLTWYGDSGAIIVGAGGAYPGGPYPEGDLERIFFSAYGSRFNLQGWGEDVVTTGYGDLWDQGNKDDWFTNTFAGTSSASAIVAGAVSRTLGYWQAMISPNLPTPAQVRSILASTGTPQVYGAPGNIGPRPDLLAAFAALPTLWINVALGPTADPAQSFAVAWGDLDADGDPDLFGTSSGGNYLVRNDGAGTVYGWNPQTHFIPGLAGSGAGNSAVWGDYDNDGLEDLYISNYNSANQLFQNSGGSLMADVTSGPLGDTGPTNAIAWVDYDNDGDLDLYLTKHAQANRLLRNDGGGSFADAATGPLGSTGYGMGVAWADYDDDGDQDLYLVNYGMSNDLLRNDGGGTFTNTTHPLLTGGIWGTGVAWGDYDNDSDLDLYTVNVGSANQLFRNDGNENWADVTTGPLGDAGFGGGVAWADYDNDGDLDLYLANTNSANRLLRNDGGTVFADDTVGPLGYTGYSNGVAWADTDSDGDQDLYVANLDGPNLLFLNGRGSLNNWIQVDLVGVVSNASGIGARIEILTSAGSQIRELSGSSGHLSQNSLTASFGLGSVSTVDRIRVFWPSGLTQDSLVVAANQRVVIVEDAATAAVLAAEPLTYQLERSFPNPFRETTTIRYSVPEPRTVSLRIYDVAGRLVRNLVEAPAVEPGHHRILWDGRDQAGRRAAPGVYFYRLQAGPYHETHRTVLLR